MFVWRSFRYDCRANFVEICQSSQSIPCIRLRGLVVDNTPSSSGEQSFRRWLLFSDHPFARAARTIRSKARTFEIPAPRVIVLPILLGFLAARGVFHFLKKKLVTEPLFKAYCTSYGRRIRAGVFIPWITGKGQIHLGDGVYIHGRFSVSFAARFSDRPTLTIGANTGFGNNVSIVVAKSVSVGRNCLISSGTLIADSGGHPTDPLLRLAGLPPLPEEVRPVVIEDNVWIATGSVILPGVTVGEGSVITAGSVVRRSVPPYSIVMGNPAKVVAPLPRPEANGTLVPPNSPETDPESDRD
jgi:serine acetyltransferase